MQTGAVGRIRAFIGDMIRRLGDKGIVKTLQTFRLEALLGQIQADAYGLAGRGFPRNGRRDKHLQQIDAGACSAE